MKPDADTRWLHRQLLAFVARRRAERKALVRRRRSRESMATMMLTTLAASLGVFALAVLLAGLAGNPLARWSEPQTMLACPLKIKGMYWCCLRSGNESDFRAGARVIKLFLPSRECRVLWLLGLLLILPVVLRRGVKRSVVLSLALLMPTGVIIILIMFLSALGYLPSFAR